MKRLLVDDARSPENFEALVVRNPREALVHIQTNEWDEVWLDHDNDFVPDEPDYDYVTRALAEDEWLYPTKLFVLHSANMRGRERMRNHLEGYEVIDIEDYPDRSLRVSGGGVVPVSVAGGIERSTR